MSGMDDTSTKVKEIGGKGAFAKYREMMYGELPLGKVILAEVLFLLLGGLPGVLGLGLRKMCYPVLFPQMRGKVVFGRNVTIRHPHKIRFGDGVIVDDNAVIDAKGSSNLGLDIGDGVYIGRNTIVYCKNGDITLEDRVNISSNCQLFSSNRLRIGRGTVVGAYSYFLSGGEYDYADATLVLRAERNVYEGSDGGGRRLLAGGARDGAGWRAGGGSLCVGGGGAGE